MNSIRVYEIGGYEIPFASTVFPGGEPHVQLDPAYFAGRRVWDDADAAIRGGRDISWSRGTDGQFVFPEVRR